MNAIPYFAGMIATLLFGSIVYILDTKFGGRAVRVGGFVWLILASIVPGVNDAIGGVCFIVLVLYGVECLSKTKWMNKKLF